MAITWKKIAYADQLHTQGTDTALGAVGTKNPPIDADKALYRDSTTSDVLVTSTWAQIKAFLKTYFDGLYAAVLGADDNYVTDAEKAALHAVGDSIASSISDGDTTHSPDGNSVFDALALKAPLASPIFTTQITTPIISLTGGQIAFPASQAASANVNTLDDYEEGTWTPGYAPESGANFTSVTYEWQYGAYVKIGRAVICTFSIRTTAINKGSATGGAYVNITGLPFTSHSSAAVGPCWAVLGISSNFVTKNPSHLYIWNNQVIGRLSVDKTTTALTVDNMNTGAASNFCTGSFIYMSA